MSYKFGTFFKNLIFKVDFTINVVQSKEFFEILLRVD